MTFDEWFDVHYPSQSGYIRRVAQATWQASHDNLEDAPQTPRTMADLQFALIMKDSYLGDLRETLEVKDARIKELESKLKIAYSTLGIYSRSENKDLAWMAVDTLERMK